MNSLRGEKGMILLTVLILMVIGTIIGTIAINSSTVEVQISGNTKRVSTAFAAAEGGMDLAVPIIESALGEGMTFPGSFAVDGDTVVIDPLMQDRIRSGAPFDNDTTDFSIPSLNEVSVDVDVDYMYTIELSGGAITFAAAYDGVGSGAASGGTASLYRIRSSGTK